MKKGHEPSRKTFSSSYGSDSSLQYLTIKKFYFFFKICGCIWILGKTHMCVRCASGRNWRVRMCNSNSVIKSILTRVEFLTITKSKWNKFEWIRLFHQVFVCLANVGKWFSMAIVIYTNFLVTSFIFSTLITSIPFLEFSPISPRGNPFRPHPFALYWISNWK